MRCRQPSRIPAAGEHASEDRVTDLRRRPRRHRAWITTNTPTRNVRRTRTTRFGRVLGGKVRLIYVSYLTKRPRRNVRGSPFAYSPGLCPEARHLVGMKRSSWPDITHHHQGRQSLIALQGGCASAWPISRLGTSASASGEAPAVCEPQIRTTPSTKSPTLPFFWIRASCMQQRAQLQVHGKGHCQPNQSSLLRASRSLTRSRACVPCSETTLQKGMPPKQQCTIAKERDKRASTLDAGGWSAKKFSPSPSLSQSLSPALALGLALA